MHFLDKDVVLFYNSMSPSEKQKILRNIIAKGDAMYNSMHPESPIVKRRQTRGENVLTKTKCSACNMLFSDKHVVNHIRKCKEGLTHHSGSSLRVQINKEKFQLHETLNKDMKTRILPTMRNDNIRKLCETDQSLILYGNKMCNRLKGEKQEKTIRNHLRILGRVTEKTTEVSSEPVASAAEIFQPTNYDAFILAITIISGYGEAEGQEMAKPTTPHQYGPKMRELFDCLLTELLKQLRMDNTQQPDLER